MLDSEEIARRALFRADEIKAEKKHQRQRMQKAGIASGVCAVVLVVGMKTLPYAGLSPDSYEILESGPVPLAAPLLPDASAQPYTGEWEENDNGCLIPNIGTVTVGADALDMELLLFNPEENHCYFTFDVVLQDTEETLYSSGLVKPASFIEKIKLARPLAKGKYDAVLTIHTYTLDSLTLASSTDEYFTLIVK